MDLYERIMELGSMGYHCSQIIMIMTLETIGEENPQLVKAMGGLGGGIGYCGDTCGCLTGGACAIRQRKNSELFTVRISLIWTGV